MTILEFIDGNLSQIITGIISFTAICFSYLQARKSMRLTKENLTKQLQVQIEVTTEKERINMIRGAIVDILRDYMYCQENSQDPKTWASVIESYNRLAFLLNCNEMFENALLQKFDFIFQSDMTVESYAQVKQSIRECYFIAFPTNSRHL